MNLKPYLFAITAVLALVTGCKDDDDDTSLYFNGSVSLSIPSYVNPGDVFYFAPTKDVEGNCVSTTIERSDESDTRGIGYYFSVSQLDILDTLIYEDGTGVGEYTFVVPDTLASLSVSIVAFGEDYYTSTGGATVVVVKPGYDDDDSITSFNLYDKATFTDPRDNKEYYTTTYNGKTWMREDLAYFEKDGDDYTFGTPYARCKAMEDVFGGYYTWEEAQKACPDGWRIPTAEDWATLGKSAGDLLSDSYFNGEKMWEFWPAVKITDNTHFSALPVGYAQSALDYTSFTGVYYYAIYWGNHSGKGCCHYMYVGENDIKDDFYPGKDFAAPVRCVRD